MNTDMHTVRALDAHIADLGVRRNGVALSHLDMLARTGTTNGFLTEWAIRRYTELETDLRDTRALLHDLLAEQV